MIFLSDFNYPIHMTFFGKSIPWTIGSGMYRILPKMYEPSCGKKGLPDLKIKKGGTGFQCLMGSLRECSECVWIWSKRYTLTKIIFPPYINIYCICKQHKSLPKQKLSILISWVIILVLMDILKYNILWLSNFLQMFLTEISCWL